MGSIRVAIVGVGNCAASLVQGVHYYRDADPRKAVPGLMHVDFGGYHVRDIEFVAAFDVDSKKVGLDLADAIGASENNTIKICDVPRTGVTVERGHTLDGLGKYYREMVTESDEAPVDVVAALRPDLAVVVMSATLDEDALAGLLGGAPVIRAPGRAHPVTTNYLPVPGGTTVEQEIGRAHV